MLHFFLFFVVVVVVVIFQTKFGVFVYSPNGVATQGKDITPDSLKEKPSLMKKELDEARRKAIVLEQECEVYRSQLEVSVFVW